MSFFATSQISSCEDAFSELLKIAVQGKYNAEHPSPAELRTFLLNTSEHSQITEHAVELLLRSEAGRRAIIQDAYLFAAKFGNELSRNISRERDKEDLWIAIWRLPAQEGVSLGPELRAEIFANIQKLTGDDFFSDLNPLRSEANLADLEVYETRLSDRRPEIAHEIQLVRTYLQSCASPLLPKTEPCDLNALSSPAQRFVHRVEIQWLIHANEENRLPIIDFIKRLGAMDLSKSRTPALHEALIRAINDASKDPILCSELSREEHFPLLRMFAANDRILAFRWVSLLTKQAGEYFRSGNYDQSLVLLEESFKAFSEPVEGRIAFLNSVVYSDAWKERSDIRQRFREVVRRGVPPRPWYDLTQEKLVGIFAILAGLSFLWMIYVYLARERRSREERAVLETEMIALAEREELRELRVFFDIDPSEGEAELTKSYRRKAKETHPDLYGGQTEKFQEIQDKYQRAKELLSRRRRS